MAAYPSSQQLVQMALDHVRAVCKGNGIKIDRITVSANRISDHIIHAGTYLELKPVISEKVIPGKIGGDLTAGREEAMSKVDQTMISAARDAGVKAQLSAALLNRPDKGFGLQGQVIPLDFLKKEFTWHEHCPTCRGSAQGPCQKCGGRRVETCIKCTGRGLMACPMCRTTGLINGQKCTRCFGQRYVPCDQCQRSGVMPCRTCRGTGVSQCAACGGQGWKSHVLTVMTQGLTYFEYDAKDIPKSAADILETHASDLVQTGAIKADGRIADDKENILGASYEVTFPAGTIAFMIGGKEVKCGLFGYKAELHDFPYVLDKLLQKPVEELEDAAKDVGSVAQKIRQASRFRLIAQALLLTTRTSAQKTSASLLKKYDIGLSAGLADKIAKLADEATSQITKKPRYNGFALGATISGALMAAYYIAPLRAHLAAMLPDQRFDMVLDILPVILGGFISGLCIQAMAGQAIRKALGHLLPPQNKKSLAPKTGALGSWGYGIAVITMIMMIEIAHLQGKAIPFWYDLIRSTLGLQ